MGSKGWPKVHTNEGVSAMPQPEQFSVVFGRGKVWNDEGQLVYDSQRRTVEWAQQSALEREARMNMPLVEPGNGAGDCLGSRAATIDDLPESAKYEPCELRQ